MDDRDIVEIPDTPDRVRAPRSYGGCNGKERNPSMEAHSSCPDLNGEECLNQLRGKGKLHHQSSFGAGIGSGSNPIVLSPMEKSHASSNSLLFRKPTFGINHRHDIDDNKRSAATQDKGKTPCTTTSPIKPPTNLRNNPSLRSNDQERLLEMALPPKRPESVLDQNRRESRGRMNGGSSLYFAQRSREAEHTSKGKEKIGDAILKDASSATVGEGNDTSSQPPVIPAAVSGRKRLVRNGCISPQAIAVRSKQIAECEQNSAAVTTSELNDSGNTTSTDPSLIDIGDIVADDDISGRGKGKRTMTHLEKSRKHEREVTNSSNRHACGLEGWRSSRDRSVRSAQHLPEISGIPSARGDNGRRTFCPRNEDKAVVRGPEQRSQHINNRNAKMQQPYAIPAGIRGDFSKTFSSDPEIVCLGSGESSRSRECRIQYGRANAVSDQVLENEDESYARARQLGDSQPESSGGGDNNDESYARARQVEADELFARELQEKLYEGVPIFEDNERSSLPPQTRSQNSLRTAQRPSNRRGGTSRAAGSNRSRLRRRFGGRSASSSTSDLHFPSYMDLDVRLDILEALEAVVGGDANDDIYQTQRDFTDTDYEMLLGLDENNHQVGSSVNQINSLPESIVQTENLEEACAVCLESPSVGETIRHLPCLHKFHKDCIDQWLSRSTSCPVCKSSIT